MAETLDETSPSAEMGPATVDYDFCKGCGVCAKVCPVPCITMVDEQEGGAA